MSNTDVWSALRSATEECMASENLDELRRLMSLQTATFKAQPTETNLRLLAVIGIVGISVRNHFASSKKFQPNCAIKWEMISSLIVQKAKLVPVKGYKSLLAKLEASVETPAHPYKMVNEFLRPAVEKGELVYLGLRKAKQGGYSSVYGPPVFSKPPKSVERAVDPNQLF